MFFSKKKGPKITDIVYMNEHGCYNALAQWLNSHPAAVAASWFSHDLEELRASMTNIPAERFIAADKLAYSHSSGREVVFVGHYPLPAVEQGLCEQAGIENMLVYSHLDMPLLTFFGSEHIRELMVRMGMNEDEPVSHAMITTAITRAQEKIASMNVTDMRALSAEEWMKINLQEKNR